MVVVLQPLWAVIKLVARPVSLACAYFGPLLQWEAGRCWKEKPKNEHIFLLGKPIKARARQQPPGSITNQNFACKSWHFLIELKQVAHVMVYFV